MKTKWIHHKNNKTTNRNKKVTRKTPRLWYFDFHTWGRYWNSWQANVPEWDGIIPGRPTALLAAQWGMSMYSLFYIRAGSQFQSHVFPGTVLNNEVTVDAYDVGHFIVMWGGTGQLTIWALRSHTFNQPYSG